VKLTAKKSFSQTQWVLCGTEFAAHLLQTAAFGVSENRPEAQVVQTASVLDVLGTTACEPAAHDEAGWQLVEPRAA